MAKCMTDAAKTSKGALTNCNVDDMVDEVVQDTAVRIVLGRHYKHGFFLDYTIIEIPGL